MSNTADKPKAAAAPTRRGRYAARSPRSRGAVLALTLFGAFMVIAMIGYVFNTGRHAQLRQQTQNAVDATAISGGGYVARSFNTVAMNNVEIARLIAAVQMLDSVPLAAEYTLIDIESWLERMYQQESAGVCPVRSSLLDRLVNSLDTGYDDEFPNIAPDLRRRLRGMSSDIDRRTDEALREAIGDLEVTREELEQMDRYFSNEFDVTDMTFYDNGGQRGEMWKAMESLDAISTATMEHLDELTHLNSNATGLANLPYAGNRTVASMVIPEGGIAPWERFDFDDFRMPVVHGQLPAGSDDPVVNRGPFDVIYNWTTPVLGQPTGNTRERGGGSSGPERNVRSGRESGWSGGPGGGGGRGRSTSVEYEVIGYRTYGTFPWMQGVVWDYFGGSNWVLEETQFARRLNGMAGNKLNYIWPNSTEHTVLLDPQWINNYEQAERIVDARTPRAAYTYFLRLQIMQTFTYLPEDPFLRAATGMPQVIEGAETNDWDMLRRPGGVLSVPGISEKSCDHVWDDGWLIDEEGNMSANIINGPGKIGYVNSIRNNPSYTLTRDDGQPFTDGDDPSRAARVSFPVINVYVGVVRFVWIAMNVGPQIEVRNPNNFDGSSPLPAPIDFDYSGDVYPYSDYSEWPYSPFTYLVMADQPNDAPMWNRLFNRSLHDGHTAIAQVGVFNNHSWDLWTQMWHAQLEPVQQYEWRVDNISADDQETQELIEYLQSLKPLAPTMLHH